MKRLRMLPRTVTEHVDERGGRAGVAQLLIGGAAGDADVIEDIGGDDDEPPMSRALGRLRLESLSSALMEVAMIQPS